MNRENNHKKKVKSTMKEVRYETTNDDDGITASTLTNYLASSLLKVSLLAFQCLPPTVPTGKGCFCTTFLEL